MKILMFGRTGQVATEIARRLPEGWSLTALSRAEADLADPAACAAAVTASEADAVINAAAWTAVDKAEEAEAEATVINGTAPGAMARAAAAKGVPFLHISTDYVFDGSGTRPWREDDPVAPLGAYGRSKLAGEREVTAAGGPHVILRTAWVHAGHGANFVGTMLRVGATRPRLTVVDDQVGGPTPAGAIADALLAIAAGFREGRGESGIFHFCGAPAVSWCGFARAIFAASGREKIPEVAPIATADWPTPAARPANSVLDCTRLAEVWGIAQPDWRAHLPAIIEELQESAR